MSMGLENKIKVALTDIDNFMTADCLDVDTVGLYVENKLPEPQKAKVEAHLHTCLYCLKQLNDMTEILHIQRKHATVSQVEADQYPVPRSLSHRIKDFFSFSPLQWRYSAITLATAWMVFIVSIAVLRQGREQHARVPHLNPNSLVKVSAFDKSGKLLRAQQGVIVSDDGYIESNLTPLAGATKIKVTLRDGRTREIDKIWADDESNLAVMRVEENDLQGVRMTDVASIDIGHKIFAVPDSEDEAGSVSDAIVCDFKQTSGRRSNSSMQYIQVSTQNIVKNTGKLLDEKGNLIGFIITENEHINFATPAQAFKQLVKSTKAIPVSELQPGSFSSEALNLYMKGILARDAQRVDEAMVSLQQAVKLNPRLTGAYLELADLYYKKHQFDKEAQAYETVLKVNPINVDALYGLAWNKESFGKYQEATTLYLKALALEPEDTDILYQLGLSYLAQNNKSKAMEMSVRLKKLEPGKGEMLRRLMK
jgi:S1-C subfamily serine protease